MIDAIIENIVVTIVIIVFAVCTTVGLSFVEDNDEAFVDIYPEALDGVERIDEDGAK